MSNFKSTDLYNKKEQQHKQNREARKNKKGRQNKKRTAGAMVDAGKRLAQGFKEGYESGMKDFAEEQKSKTVKAPINVTAASAGTKKSAIAATVAKDETKGAVGQKAVTINVSIGSLIKDFQIKTTNITEGSAKVREMVAQALLSATNDSQLMAGQ